MPAVSRRRAWALGAFAATVLVPVTVLATANPSQAATTVTVASDGSGNYTTIQSAISAVSSGSTIKIKPGTYDDGQVSIPASKSNLTLVGTSGSAADVIITGDTPQSEGSASTTATMLNLAEGTTIQAVTIQNTYGSGSQALALYAGGDRQFYRNVTLKGHQDTLLSWKSSASTEMRQYFYKSYIYGDVDFIYGNGTLVIDSSKIVSLDRGSSSNNGYITASATYSSNTYGILITDSSLITDSADTDTVSLGRCWHPGGSTSVSGQVLIRDSSIGGHVRQEDAWMDMGGFSWSTCRFYEYNNTGSGKSTDSSDRPQMSSSTAANYTAEKYLYGTDGWDPVVD